MLTDNSFKGFIIHKVLLQPILGLFYLIFLIFLYGNFFKFYYVIIFIAYLLYFLCLIKAYQRMLYGIGSSIYYASIQGFLLLIGLALGIKHHFGISPMVSKEQLWQLSSYLLVAGIMIILILKEIINLKNTARELKIAMIKAQVIDVQNMFFNCTRKKFIDKFLIAAKQKRLKDASTNPIYTGILTLGIIELLILFILCLCYYPNTNYLIRIAIFFYIFIGLFFLKCVINTLFSTIRLFLVILGIEKDKGGHIRYYQAILTK